MIIEAERRQAVDRSQAVQQRAGHRRRERLDDANGLAPLIQQIERGRQLLQALLEESSQGGGRARGQIPKDDLPPPLPTRTMPGEIERETGQQLGEIGKHNGRRSAGVVAQGRPCGAPIVIRQG
jgi:hypothetical protein